MKTFDDEAASALSEWSEKEFRATLGARPRQEIQEDNEYDPKGPHKWFAESVADISAIIALREMSETWRVRPPYPSWRSCAPGIRQRADEMVLAAKLPPGVTFVQWFAANEVLLQEEPERSERTRIVAVALLPLFEEKPDCWDAMNWLDDDMTHETFRECLRDWHSRVPEQHRPFVRRIAAEFGIEIDDRVGR